MIRHVGLSATLRHRLLYVLFFFLVTATAVTTWLARHAADRALTEQREAATTLAALAADAWALRHADTDTHALLATIGAHPTLHALTVRDAAGRTLYRFSKPAEEHGWIGGLYATDEEDRRIVRELTGSQNGARIELLLAHRPRTDALIYTLAGAATLVAALLMIFGIFARTLLRHFAAPLQRLILWAHQSARGAAPALPAGGAVAHFREVQDLERALSENVAANHHRRQRLDEAAELLEHNEIRLRTLIGSMREALVEFDANGRLRSVNAAWEKITGCSQAESVGRPITDFLLDDNLAHDIAAGELSSLDRQVQLQDCNDRRVWAQLRTEVRRDARGRVHTVIAMLGDVTAHVELRRLVNQYQDELYQLSVIDPLTGLYNRPHFDAQLEAILAEHLPLGQPVCLLLIDLDGFKFINDTYGHPLGDEVLRTTAQLLRHQIRRNDYVARLAGDEFAMVLKNTDLDSATVIARKLHACINEKRVPLPVGTMQLQSSIGVAEAPTHANNARELVSAADVALYHSKQHGPNRVEVLSPDMSKAVMSLFSQGFRLRHALEHGFLQPAFQPIRDLVSGETMAVEVLARMRIDGDIIHAKDFIAVAEELGLTRELDLHIIGRALELTPPDQALFLNVDLSSFADRTFARELRRLLEPACRSGRLITIEITERETTALTQTLFADIHSLRELGCRLALDDFGSGYSTYNFLNQFRPDFLKIEGSFVRGMLRNESDHKIVTHIHELARSFGMQTIAECVEDEATASALRHIGIGNAQGHFYGEPVLAA